MNRTEGKTRAMDRRLQVEKHILSWESVVRQDHPRTDRSAG